ncbi:MAG: DUF5723 family protein [Bacteroidales bacterium]
MKRFCYVLAISLLINFNLTGQEMTGIAGSNYAGILGIGINPSMITGSKLYMDFHLISGNVLVENDWAYWTWSDMAGYLKNGEYPDYFTVAGEERDFTIYRDQSGRSGYLSGKILGPSGMVVHGRHAFGVTTAFRTVTSFKNMWYDAALFLYEGLDYRPLQQIPFTHDNRMSLAALSWFEAGFSYAFNFHRYRWDSWSAGITIKPLFGGSGMSVFIDNVDYYVHNDDSASVYSADFRYSYAMPLDSRISQLIWPTFSKGYGFSVDVGITFWKTAVGHSLMSFSRICEPRFEPYNYKIGISLLDLGFIRFSENAESFTYTDAYTEYYDPWDTLPGKTIAEINTKIEYYFPTAVFKPEVNNTFSMNLPTVLSIQGDYHIRYEWYIQGLIYQPLAFSKNSISRPFVAVFAPRYETARMETSFPVTIFGYKFNKVMAGISFRYENFFVGTDNLLALAGLVDFSGFNLHAGIRLNLSGTLRMNYLKGLCNPARYRNIETFDYRNF